MSYTLEIGRPGMRHDKFGPDAESAGSEGSIVGSTLGVLTS